MSRTMCSGEERPNSWCSFSDVPRMACNAAMELDGYLLAKRREFDSVERFKELVSSSFLDLLQSPEQASMLDPLATGIMSGAIDDSPFKQPKMTTLKEFSATSKTILAALTALVEAPDEQGEDKIKDLRKFLLAFARNALAVQSPTDVFEPVDSVEE